MINYTKNNDRNHKITIKINKTFDFAGDKYRTDKTDDFVVKLKEKFVYRFEANAKCDENVCFQAFIAFFDKEGKELAKLHLEDGIEITTVPGTVSGSVQFWAGSQAKGKAEVSEAFFIPLHPKCKREAVLAAIAIKYADNERTPEKNLDDALERIDRVSVEKPDLIVLTELFYSRDTNLPIENVALSLNGDIIKRIREKAKKYNTYIAFSNYVYNENGNISNKAVLIDRNGEIATTYDKTHFTMGEILSGIEPGKGPVVYDCDFGRVGFAICWDLFFPEFTRLYHLENVDVIINPSAGFEVQRNSERAKETGAYIVCSGMHRLSDSRIFSPGGSTLDKGDERGYAVAKVDLNKEFYVKWLSANSYSTRKNVFKYERVPRIYR